MQRVWKCALVVSLLAALTVAENSSRATERLHRIGKADAGIIETILNYFGITLQSRVSIPPG